MCEVVKAQSEPAILVGHSMGGISITQTAENCPDNIRKLVYLIAFLLPNGENASQQFEGDTESLLFSFRVSSEEEGYSTVKDEGIKHVFYADCSDEDVAWAKSLVAPQVSAPSRTPVSTTDENFGRIPRVYFECLQDKCIPPYIQKKMYTNLPCEKVISMETSHGCPGYS